MDWMGSVGWVYNLLGGDFAGGGVQGELLPSARTEQLSEVHGDRACGFTDVPHFKRLPVSALEVLMRSSL